MQNETKTPGKKAAPKSLTSKDIRVKYQEYVLVHGAQPPSIFLFSKSLQMKEEQFYQFYNSFQAIEKDIWRLFFVNTIQAIESEEVYREYSSRERLLSFYYTMLEELKSHRSYILWQSKEKVRPGEVPYYLKSFRAEFLSWARGLIKEGQEKGEIIDRPVIGKRYDDALWLQTMFILHFWIKDDSMAFEKTDAAIEKAVNLAFDFMGRGPVDSLIDFGKFLFQTRRES